MAALQVPAVHVLRAAKLLRDRENFLQPHSFRNKSQSQTPAHLHCVQVSCFGCLEESVVHVGVARGNIFYTFMNEKNRRSQSKLEYQPPEAVTTVENLLYSLVAHLGGSEALQGDDGGISPVAEQQLAGLDVASQSCPVEGRLAEGVGRIHLQADRLPLALRVEQTQTRNRGRRDLGSVLLQHLQDVIVSSLCSNMQRGHKA